MQLPENFNIHTCPLLTSMSDQGGINRAGLDYLAYKLGIPISIQWDCFHRGWNDIKHCLKDSKGQLFKVMLSYSLLWNTSYGPFGSKEWFSKRQGKLDDMMATSSPHTEPFLSFLPLICQEQNIPEPTDIQGREHVWNSIKNMNCMCALGPIVKLMRWYSWFQAEEHYCGENWAMKLVMLDDKHVAKHAGYIISEETAAGVEFCAKDLKSHKDELRKLKMSHGTFALAPLLVTCTSMWQKDLIKYLCKPSWSIHADRAQNCLSPHHHVAFMVKNVCQGMWKEELLSIMRQGFLSPSVLKQLYPPLGTSQAILDGRLQIHMDFLCKLLAKRSMSICAQFQLPPIRYAGLLGSHQQQRTTQAKMLKDWEQILQWESKAAQGEHIQGLESLHFLQSSFCRLGYLVNEDDVHNMRSQAQVWMKAAILHFGDSAIIENSHQAAKDTLLEARHHQRSRVHKQMAVINSRVMQTRQTPHVSVNELELSQTSMKSLPAFAPMTHPNSHFMKKQFQQLMQYKSGKHFWHSTSAVSQFEEYLAFEYLLQTEVFSSMHLSCLAGPPGTVLVSDSQGLALLVLAKGMHGFTGWVLEPSHMRGAIAFKPIDRPEGFLVQRITKIDAWKEIPCKPFLLNSRGALMFLQDGPAESLPVARIHAGLNLTVIQCKQILKQAKDILLKGNPSKLEVYTAFIAAFMPDADQAAIHDLLAVSTAKITEESEEAEDKLSDYEDLLDLVEEDCNHGDPDIKQEKKKLKRKRLGLGKVKDTGGADDSIMLEPGKENKVKKPKSKAKPKAMGRGRGRGRGRGKSEKADLPIPDAEEKKEISVEEIAKAFDEEPAKADPDAEEKKEISVEEIAKAFDEEPAKADPELEAFFADSPRKEPPDNKDVADAASPECAQAEDMGVLEDSLSPTSPAVDAPDTPPEAHAQIEEAEAFLEAAADAAEASAATEAPEAFAQIEAETPLEAAAVPAEASAATEAPEAHAQIEAEAPLEAAAVPATEAPEAQLQIVQAEAPLEPAAAPPEAATLEAPSQIAQAEAPEPESQNPEAASSRQLPRKRGPNQYASPPQLTQLSPPGCSIRMNSAWEQKNSDDNMFGYSIYTYSHVSSRGMFYHVTSRYTEATK